MMTCDTMVRLVHEMYEIADKISKAYHDIIAARISHQVEGATYGTEF
jgi:hypothetical protein